MVRLIPSLWKVTRDNEFLEDLTPHIKTGKVEFNPDRRIKWSFDGTVSVNANITPFVDYIAPQLTVMHEDGHSETSQFGVYSIMPPRQTITSNQQTFEINSADLTSELNSDELPNGYTVGEGVNIANAVRTLLTGFRHTIPNHSSTMPAVKSWKAGTSRLTIVNDLLNMISHYSLFMSKDGRLTTMAYVTDKNKAPSVTYAAPSTNRVQVIRNIQRDTTADRIRNQIIVVGGPSTDEPIIATARNTNPLSPTSIPSLNGRVLSRTIEGAQVADQAAADVMAQRLLDEASQEYHRLTLTTTHDVSVEPYMVYRLEIVHPATREVVVDGIWNSRGWSIGFTPDVPMEHQLSNIDTPPMEMEG